jgi:glutamate-1-semialdehyde 2,1-aminomutase
MHGNFLDNQVPAPGYWQEVRKLCTENNIVLIIDDIRCGFRLDLSGSDHYYGFEADLITFCKALANGYNVSAICGKQFLKAAAGSIMYTGSYWMSAAPFAAGIACLKKLMKSDACAHFKKIGTMLCDGLVKLAQERGINLKVSGEPALFYLMIKDDDSLLLHQEWIAECVKRGLWLTNHHNHFINLAMTEETVKESLAIAAEAMDVLVANHPEVYKKK